MIKTEQKSISCQQESSDTPISGECILKFACDVSKVRSYFTLFDLAKNEASINAFLRNNKKIDGKERQNELEKRFLDYLKKYLFQLVRAGFLNVDQNNYTTQKKNQKTYKLDHFFITKNGEKYIQTHPSDLKPDELCYDTVIEKKETQKIDVLDELIILPNINKVRRKIATLRSTKAPTNFIIQHHQDTLRTNFQDRYWKKCVDSCLSFAKEYAKLSNLNWVFKYLISALYFNWLGQKRYNIWNASWVGQGMVKFKHGKLERALRYFSQSHMKHLPLETVERFARIYS